MHEFPPNPLRTPSASLRARAPLALCAGLGLAMACGRPHHDRRTAPPDARHETANPDTPGDTEDTDGRASPEATREVRLANLSRSCATAEGATLATWRKLRDTLPGASCDEAAAKASEATSLSLAGAEALDLAVLKDMTQLTKLDLSQAHVDDGSWAAMPSLTRLAELNLAGNALTTCALPTLPRLASVSFKDNPLVRCHVPARPALTSLELGNSPQLEAFTLEAQPALVTLKVRNVGLATLALPALPALAELNVTRAPRLAAVTLAAAPALRVAVVNANPALVRWEARGLKALDMLDLRGNALADVVWDGAPAVLDFHLGKNAIAAPARLQGDLAHVTMLTLRDNPLTDVCPLKPRLGPHSRLLVSPGLVPVLNACP